MTVAQLSEVQLDRVRKALESVPFAKLIGIELETAAPGLAVMSFEIREELMQNNQVVHGGAIASLIDSAMAIAIIPLLAENESTTTVDLTINYLRPLRIGRATATAHVLRAGRRVIALSAEVTNDVKDLAATALSSYLRLPAK